MNTQLQINDQFNRINNIKYFIEYQKLLHTFYINKYIKWLELKDTHNRK